MVGSSSRYTPPPGQKGTLGVALWFRRSRFKQFELTANAVKVRILPVCMTSTTQCFLFVVPHSPHSGQAADEVAMDSCSHRACVSYESTTPDERVLLGDFQRFCWPSEELGLRPSPGMGVVFENFWIGKVCVQSTHLWEMPEKRRMGMVLSKEFETVVSCRILDGVELSENTRVDYRALAVSFHSSFFSFANQEDENSHACSSQDQSSFMW